MKYFVALSVSLTLACAHVAPATVKASNGPVCQGLDFPADMPCLEKGEPAPFGGLEVTPAWANADAAEHARVEAENASLRRSVALDVGLVGGAVAFAIACAVAGFELGRSTK